MNILIYLLKFKYKKITCNIILLINMSLVTTNYETICPLCKTSVSSLRLDDSKMICTTCFMKDGRGVKGASSLRPCRLCTVPNIRWYTKKMYGKIKQDCGNHNGNEEDNSD